MSASTVVSEIIPRKAADEGVPRANFAYSAAQTVTGLLVPLFPIWLARPVLRGRMGGLPRAAILFAFAAGWLLVLGLQFATFALLGSPPFTDPPKLDPLTLWVAVKAALRGFLGVLQLQAVATLGFDWIFLRSIPNASFQLDELNRS